MSTHLNEADAIDRALERYGHRIWGFVIYRTTYTSDADWNECMRMLHSEVEDSLQYFHGLDLLDKNPFTIFDDPALFDNATAADVRQHFANWVQNAPIVEQGIESSHPMFYGGPTRYNFCLQIDEPAMRSILAAALVSPDIEGEGYYRLIRRNWELRSEEDIQEEADEGGLDVSSLRYEPVEGSTQRDVGWMKLGWRQYLFWYCVWDNADMWYTQYQRPPALVIT